MSISADTLDSLCNVEYGTRVVQRRDGGSIYPVYGGGGPTFEIDFHNRDSCVVVARFGMSPQCTRFVAGKFFLNDSGLTVSPKNGTLDRRFLDHQILSLNDAIYALGKGSAQKNLDVPAFRSIPLFVPALPEQQRIVAILDEAFAAIATARSNAEKNFESARELFESELNAIFERGGDEWHATTLGTVYDVRDGTHDSPKYYSSGYPLITSKNLKRDGLTLNDVKLISKHDYDKINKRSAVHKGDVLYAMIGTIGNPTIVDVVPSFAIKNVALFKVPKAHDSRFLRYALSSSRALEKMMTDSKGTTQKFVSLGYLRDFPIRVPSGAQERSIANTLDELALHTTRLETLYASKLTKLNELRASILHKAFNGEI